MEALKNVKSILGELRQSIGAGYRAGEVLPFTLFCPGFTRGTIVEIVGSGKTEFLTRFLAENPSLRVAWIESEMTIYPFAFLQREVDLSRLLFVETASEMVWSVLQILHSQIFQVVAISSGGAIGGFDDLHGDDRTLRKIQLAAERSRSVVVFLNENSFRSWVPSVQLEVKRPWEGEDFQVNMIRRRAGAVMGHHELPEPAHGTFLVKVPEDGAG